MTTKNTQKTKAGKGSKATSASKAARPDKYTRANTLLTKAKGSYDRAIAGAEAAGDNAAADVLVRAKAKDAGADKPQPKAAEADVMQPKPRAASSKREPKATTVVATGGASAASATPAPGRGQFTDDLVIKVLVDANPKKPGTKAFEKFALLRTGQTVAAYRQAVEAHYPGPREARDELGWCLKQKWITVGKGKA